MYGYLFFSQYPSNFINICRVIKNILGKTYWQKIYLALHKYIYLLNNPQNTLHIHIFCLRLEELQPACDGFEAVADFNDNSHNFATGAFHLYRFGQDLRLRPELRLRPFHQYPGVRLLNQKAERNSS